MADLSLGAIIYRLGYLLEAAHLMDENSIKLPTVEVEKILENLKKLQKEDKNNADEECK